MAVLCMGLSTHKQAKSLISANVNKHRQLMRSEILSVCVHRPRCRANICFGKASHSVLVSNSLVGHGQDFLTYCQQSHSGWVLQGRLHAESKD